VRAAQNLRPGAIAALDRAGQSGAPPSILQKGLGLHALRLERALHNASLQEQPVKERSLEKPNPSEPVANAAPLQLRHVLPVIASTSSDGARTSLVVCPRTEAQTPIQNCGRCGQCLGLMLNIRGLGTVLKCAWQADGSTAIDAPRLPDGPTIAELGYHSIHEGQASVHDGTKLSVLGVSANTSVARAAALMAYEGVHQLGVLNGRGDIDGVITSLDILRWLATSAGFALPPRPGPPPA